MKLASNINCLLPPTKRFGKIFYFLLNEDELKRYLEGAMINVISELLILNKITWSNIYFRQN